MVITKALIQWLVDHKHWGSVPERITSAIEFNLKNLVGELMSNGTLTADNYSQLSSGGNKMSYPSAEKMFGGHVRVKDPSEAYSTKRVTGHHIKTGSEVYNPFTGTLASYPSDLDHAKIGVLLKHLGQRSGLFPGVTLPEHEKALLHDMATNDRWAGMVGGEHHEAITGVKALVDDATSGGIMVTPYFFDDNLITFPLLTGELLPFVDLKPMDKGQRIMAGSVGNPTVSWGQGDDVDVGLFDTTALVADLNSTVFGCAVAVEVGRDFLSDAGVNVGETLTANIGQRLQAELDKMIASGNGTTQPEGILTATGLTAANAANGNAGPPTLADYLALMFAIGKQYRVQAFQPRFISNDTTFQRSRAIRVDAATPSTDQRPVMAPLTEVNSYSTLGWGHSVQNDIGNRTCVYGALLKYRLYRRVGMEVRWVDGGDTLARKNLVLLVVRARYAGRVMDANAFAKWVDGQG